eukprot:1516958-Rhodomonas_salina.1
MRARAGPGGEQDSARTHLAAISLDLAFANPHVPSRFNPVPARFVPRTCQFVPRTRSCSLLTPLGFASLISASRHPRAQQRGSRTSVPGQPCPCALPMAAHGTALGVERGAVSSVWERWGERRVKSEWDGERMKSEWDGEQRVGDAVHASLHHSLAPY